MLPPLTANALRRLAEAADNCDNRKQQAIVFDAAENKLVVVPVSELQGRTPLIQIDNTDMMAQSPVKGAVTTDASLVVDGGTLSLRTDKGVLPDSAFWGEAAMRKFVIPYYTREMTPEELADLWKAIRDPEVIALGHVCPSDYTLVHLPGHNALAPGHDLTVHLQRDVRIGEAGFLPPDQGGPATVFESVSFQDWRQRPST